MNIAILGSRGFPSTYGGYETLVRHLAPWLAAQDHDVTVYCRTRGEGRREWMTEGVRCLATAGLNTTALSTLSHGATATIDAARQNYDAVLVLNIANGFFLPLLKMRGVPTAVNTDGLEWERGKWGQAARAVFRLGATMTARHATELIADSKAIAEIWQTRFNVEPTYVPYGAEVVRSVEGGDDLTRLKISPDRYLLVVARLIPENNVELALDAIDHLADEAPPTVVVGSANFASPIETRLRRLQVQGKLKWLGHVNDQRLLSRLWSNAAVYFHGHSVGGTNPALLQALGAGAPVIALDTPFNREVIRDPVQLVPRDAHKLAERIRSLIASESDRARLRTHGQQLVAERYQWDVVCAQYLEVLRRIAGH